jgi:hypothetical protein
MSDQVALRAATAAAPACPVAELARQFYDAMQKMDDAEMEASEESPSSKNKPFLDRRAEDAKDHYEALRDMASHRRATSLAGLRFQIVELADAQDELSRNNTDKNARRVDRLIGLIADASDDLIPLGELLLAA